MKGTHSGMMGDGVIDKSGRWTVEAQELIRSALLMISVKVNSLFTLTIRAGDLFMGAVRTRGTP